MKTRGNTSFLLLPVLLAALALLLPAALSAQQQDSRSVTVRISADNIRFNKDQISVPAGARVTMVFENKEAVPHNVAAYYSEDATREIFVGEIITGPKTIEYTFTAPSEPGTYFFRCDVHPRTMVGDLVVR